MRLAPCADVGAARLLTLIRSLVGRSECARAAYAVALAPSPTLALASLSLSTVLRIVASASLHRGERFQRTLLADLVTTLVRPMVRVARLAGFAAAPLASELEHVIEWSEFRALLPHDWFARACWWTEQMERAAGGRRAHGWALQAAQIGEALCWAALNVLDGRPMLFGMRIGYVVGASARALERPGIAARAPIFSRASATLRARYHDDALSLIDARGERIWSYVDHRGRQCERTGPPPLDRMLCTAEAIALTRASDIDFYDARRWCRTCAPLEAYAAHRIGLSINQVIELRADGRLTALLGEAVIQ